MGWGAGRSRGPPLPYLSLQFDCWVRRLRLVPGRPAGRSQKRARRAVPAGWLVVSLASPPWLGEPCACAAPRPTTTTTTHTHNPPPCPTHNPSPPPRYTSKVTLQCPSAVHSRVDNSTLFSHLTNKWEFRCAGSVSSASSPCTRVRCTIATARPVRRGSASPCAAGWGLSWALPLADRRLGPTPHTTWLSFDVDFAFKSPLYRHVASVFFEEVRPPDCRTRRGLCVAGSAGLAAVARLLFPLCRAPRAACLCGLPSNRTGFHRLQVVQRMMGAFEGRCAHLYGPSSLQRRPGPAQHAAASGR